MSSIGESIEVPKVGLCIPTEAYEASLVGHIDALRHGVGEAYDYRPVIDQRHVSHIMHKNMPGIMLVLNVSLDLLATADIPNEVTKRRDIGVALARLVASSLQKRDVFAEALLAHPGYTKEDAERIKEGTSNGTFAKEILEDMTPVVGGAANFLAEHEKDQATSLSLIQFSPIAKFISRQHQIPRAILGSPYWNAKNFEWSEVSDAPAIELTDEAKQICERSVGSGCPARRISLPGMRQSLFAETWHRAAAYLLRPEYSTAE